MKKTLLFVIFFVMFLSSSNLYVFASNNVSFELVGKTTKYNFDQLELCQDDKLLSKWNRTGTNFEKIEMIDKIVDMGFDLDTAINFMFCGLDKKFVDIAKNENLIMKDAAISFNAKTGKFDISKEQTGQNINVYNTYQKIYDMLEKSNNIFIDIEYNYTPPSKTKKELEQYTHLKARFSTYCGSSSTERKHNIETALRAISGTILEAGETFSFNERTGERTEQAGYKKANIISNGTFVEGFGGGVCQVSTTLYNAVLRAGLKITQVHQHSLPVSYVPPSCDAMVNGKHVDLKFENTTHAPVFIRAYLQNGENAVVEVYGRKNVYDIEIKSNIVDILKKGENDIKDGLVSEAIMEVYQNGALVNSRRIRSNIYKPQKAKQPS